MVKEESEGSSVRCDNCRVDMEPQGGVNFRIGGAIGAMGFLLGKLADLGEGTLLLNVYVCPQCGRVELFNPGPGKEIQLPGHNDTPESYLKVCAKCKKTIPIASENCPFCGTKQSH